MQSFLNPTYSWSIHIQFFLLYWNPLMPSFLIVSASARPLIFLSRSSQNPYLSQQIFILSWRWNFMIPSETLVHAQICFPTSSSFEPNPFDLVRDDFFKANNISSGNGINITVLKKAWLEKRCNHQWHPCHLWQLLKLLSEISKVASI